METTSQNLCSSFGQRYIALDQRFFLVPFYFISMPNFDIMLWVFIIPLGKGYLSLILCPFTQGFWMAFVGYEKQFLRAIPRVDPITSKIFGILRHIFPSVTFLWPFVFTAMRSLPSWRFWTSIQRKVKELQKLYFFCTLFNEISVNSTFLVFTHVMRRPCWCTKQWENVAHVLHNNRIKFPKAF